MSKYKVIPTTEIVYNSRNVREKLGEGGASIVYKYESNGIQYACKKISKSRSVVEREINVLSLYKPNKYIVKYFKFKRWTSSRGMVLCSIRQYGAPSRRTPWDMAAQSSRSLGI